MKTPIHRPRAAGGFTMIELVVVLVILGVLSITAIVKSFMSQTDLDAVAKSLRSNLQFAQDLAMTHGSTYGFHQRTSTSYEIFEGSPGTPAVHPLDGTAFVIDISPIQFSGSSPDISFLKTGSPDIAADVTIGLIGGSATRSVTVTRNTGFVTIQISPGGSGCSLVTGPDLRGGGRE